MRQLVNILLIVVVFAFGAKGQIFTFPDSNFGNCIFTSIPGVFDVNKNLIISAANSSVAEVSCTGKNISSLVGINYLPNCNWLYFNYNNIDTMDVIDFVGVKKLQLIGNKLKHFEIKSAPQLWDLRLSDNQIRELNSLQNLPAIKFLNFYNNQIEKIKGIENLTDLQEIIASVNKIDSICNLDKLVNLNILDLTRNSLTFQDLVPIANHSRYNTNFKLGNQDSVGIDQKIEFTKASQVLMLQIDTDKGVNGMEYSWYKDNVLLGKGTKNSWSVFNPTIKDTGVYYCQLTNDHPNLAGIVLYARPIFVSIKDCPALQNVSLSIKNVGCEHLGSILFSPNSLDFKVSLSKAQIESIYTEKEITTLTSGVYDFKLLNSAGCILNQQQIEILDQTKECNYFTISPNGDGIEDEFYIKESGKALVFNKFGKLVREFETPAFWNGKDNNGETQMGLFIIKVGESVKYKVYTF